MLINGKQHRSVEIVPAELMEQDSRFAAADYAVDKIQIKIIDQRYLPFDLVFTYLKSSDDVIEAISEMQVRGAPLIGIIAAFGVVFCCEEALLQGGEYIEVKSEEIIRARPTAVNAENCVRKVLSALEVTHSLKEKRGIALSVTRKMMNDDVEVCRQIGEYGLEILRELSRKKNGETINILTHCNAGWLACMDYGTATAPLYLASEEGIKLHVWVDETRPRNQGARLTAWELSQNNIKNTLITDNAGGYLMREGLVDLVIVGSDRTTLCGDTANKIGTYLKALAANDNGIPFYVALPSSSIDRTDSAQECSIPIEIRNNDEIKYVEGLLNDEIQTVLITGKDTYCYNPGFDITPARLITGLITERGICKPDRESILSLFPDKAK